MPSLKITVVTKLLQEVKSRTFELCSGFSLKKAELNFWRMCIFCVPGISSYQGLMWKTRAASDIDQKAPKFHHPLFNSFSKCFASK